MSAGFFPAPGTNYTQGQEPLIAARLGALARAKGLHLIGLSGWRSPQHSVEVGGSADDPHTQGKASDTPGIEGVSESVLEQFGLTRPLAGAKEADHIQLAASTSKGASKPLTLSKPVIGTNGTADALDNLKPKAAVSDAASGTAAAIVNLLWGAIGQDAVRALLYVMFVLGGLALAYQGLKRTIGQGATK